MLSRMESQPDRIRFMVYDLEWYPETYEVRCVGFFTGIDYRVYRDVPSFLNAELNESNSGVVFFAHAGGLADVQFVLQAIMSNPEGYIVEASFSGSSAVIVRITRDKHTWIFADSYWLLRDKLSKIGQSIGMIKGGGDAYFCSDSFAIPGQDKLSCGHEKGMCIFYAPWPILIDYNEQDNRILYAGILRLQEELSELGGSLAMTIASCGMRLFRSQYLNQDIPTSDEINGIAREGYIASRVEVYNKTMTGGHYYDINSSFPHSMTFRQPGKHISRGRTWKENDEIALLFAEVIVPPMHIPPLPQRIDNRVYFPTGKWRGWFTGLDLQLLMDAKGAIKRIWRSHTFEGFQDLSEYVETLYELRRVEKDEFRRLVYKYLMNAAYGKFGESALKETLYYGIAPPKGARILRQLPNGGVMADREVAVPHMHVPIAMSVTSRSRALLTRYMWELGDPHYCDTDSITSKHPTYVEELDGKEVQRIESTKVIVSDKLGNLKEEKINGKYGFDVGIFIAPKLYRLDNHVRAKGFSKGRKKLSVEDFDAIANGEEFMQKRMLRVKEVMRSDNLAPREDIFKKRVLLKERPKRRMLEDGSTVPWSTDELKEEWVKP